MQKLIRKLKTQGAFGEKTQNSRKIQKKLKAKSQKTQKPPTPVELSCQKNVQKYALRTLVCLIIGP